MPKGVHHRNKDDEIRLGLDYRTAHVWDGSFDSTGHPVAICGAELFPKSIKFKDITPPATAVDCEDCYGE